MFHLAYRLPGELHLFAAAKIPTPTNAPGLESYFFFQATQTVVPATDGRAWYQTYRRGVVGGPTCIQTVHKPDMSVCMTAVGC